MPTVEAFGRKSGQVLDFKDMRRSALDRSKANNPAGFSTIAEVFGKEVAKKVADWLGTRGRGLMAASQGNGHSREVITINAEYVAMERVDSLWNGWLARGKLHLIAGVPEVGKTTVALS
jgi:hypothetical protein